MPFIKCPECMRETHVSQSNYDGLLQCSNCTKSLKARITGSTVVEVSVYGSAAPSLQGLPAELVEVYNETYRCLAAKCFTATELLCRKILMHVAVEKGAEEGKTFAFYLSYLQNEGYVAVQTLNWLELIRKHGNQATHAIATPDCERAEATFNFTVQLLRLIYEMEFLAAKYT